MDGSSNIPQPQKSLPFSFKRQDSAQRIPKSATQSYRLPENASHQQSIKHPTSKPFFSSLPQVHSDSSQRTQRQPTSHIARPIFGSHIKTSFKTEEDAPVQVRDQTHIATFEQIKPETNQYSPPASNVLQHPFSSSSLLASSSSRLSAGVQQPSLHFSHFPSSSYVAQNFPESPTDIQFESSRIRPSSRASTTPSELQPQPQPHSQQNATPPPPQNSNRSRSESILMLPLDNEDEMNTVALVTMTNNTNSLRMAKFELVEVKRRIESLESQLDTTKNEKAELSRRLNVTKDAAKKAIEASAKSLDELKASFKSLKKTSDESSAFVTQVRSSMTEFKEERKDVVECLKKIEPLLSDDGEYLKGSETKSLVNDLQVEYEKTQEVVSILREKLVTVSGDLVEAKTRVRELEASLLDDKMSLKLSAETLLKSSREMSDMASFLNKQKHESLDALSCAAEADGRLHTANERIVELSMALDQKVEQLTAARGVQQENNSLHSQLEGKEAEITSLGSSVTSINQTLSDARECIQEQKSKLQVLHTTIAFQEQNLKDFEDRTLKAEAQTSEQSATIQSLRDKLQQSEAREVAEGLKKERLVCERDGAINRVRVLESEVGDARRRIGERDERLHQADTQYQLLQERFDDQSVTLRITKESNGDLNERLMSVESTHAANISQLQLGIAVLQEQKTTQLDKIDAFKADLKHRQESEAAIITKYQDQLSRQESDSKRTIQLLERRADEAERNLAEANRSAEDLRAEISRKSLETKIPSTAHEEEISALEARLREQEESVKSLTLRANTVGERYKKGDLSDTEAAFAHSLINKTQALHEQENVSKANELRMRGNTIITLQSKIGILESEVARLLNAQTASGIETKSMMDVAPFIQSSSPIRPPDEDAPSQNDDSTVAIRPSSSSNPLASSTVPSTRPRISHQRTSDAHMAPILGPSSAEPQPLRSTVRTNFARLDTDGSDDIPDDIEPLSPPTKLGKRDRLSPIKEYSTTRKTRLKAGARQQDALSSEASENEHSKVVKRKYLR